MNRAGVRLVFCVSGLLCGSSGRATTNFLINGGFETPFAIPPFQTLTSNQLTGWNITSGSVDLINGYWPAFEGRQSVDLAGSTRNGGVLEQTFATIIGETYMLTFNYANNTDVSSASANILVFSNAASPLLDEDIVHSGSSSSSLSAMNYSSFSASFTAESVSTTIRFTSTGPDPIINANNGIVLDNVLVVQTVPEPSKFALLGSGVLGLLAYGYSMRYTSH